MKTTRTPEQFTQDIIKGCDVKTMQDFSIAAVELLAMLTRSADITQPIYYSLLDGQIGTIDLKKLLSKGKESAEIIQLFKGNTDD